MSSHREAPEISMDPVSDSTDVYAFVSPDNPDTVTLIANYVPLQEPAGGPNFYEFGHDVLYEIHIDNNGDGLAEIIYTFRFDSQLSIPTTFLYNDGPITSLDSPSWNRRQTYRVMKIEPRNGFKNTTLGDGLACPPCNIGPLSTPNYASLAQAAVHSLPGGRKVFAGQRAEGFYVDLGAVFDLGTLRPFQADHAKFNVSAPVLNKAGKGINNTKNVNVHSIALQVPKSELRGSGSVIGVWTTASRRKTRLNNVNSKGAIHYAGPFTQVSRLGNPLFNEVLIPLALKDFWNSQSPVNDRQFASHVSNPELATLLPVLYPGVFPNLAAYVKSGKPRADLEAILLTGIPSGVVPGFQNFGGKTQADELRLNMDIAPTAISKANNLGLIGGDAAGFPNGRRVFDDVATIELRAIAGATLPLVDPSYKADAAAGAVSMGLTTSATDLTAEGTVHYLFNEFPYLGVPYAGYDVADNNTPAKTSSY
ncbi:MAG: DUF4331 domain-containing protein [Acidimicrobiales bacterium]